MRSVFCQSIVSAKKNYVNKVCEISKLGQSRIQDKFDESVRGEPSGKIT